MTTVELNEIQNLESHGEYFSLYSGAADGTRLLNNIANKIARDFKPQSILIIGREFGKLSESFRQVDIETQSFDDFKLARKHLSLQDKKYDVIISCKEFLKEDFEKSEIDKIVGDLCGRGNIIILVSDAAGTRGNSIVNHGKIESRDEKFTRERFVKIKDYDAEYLALGTEIFIHESLKLPFINHEPARDDKKPDYKAKASEPSLIPTHNSQDIHISHGGNDIRQSDNTIQGASNSGFSLKHNASLWIRQKQSRFSALSQSALYVLESQGSIAFVKHLFRFLKGERQNIKTVFVRAPNEEESETSKYARWIRENEPESNALKAQEIGEKELTHRPLISILVPVYNTGKKELKKMLHSVVRQTYSNWELCIADGCSTEPHVRLLLESYAQKDDRIKVKFLDENSGIAGNSNEALSLAEGEFIALLDHDDELARDALYENVLLLNRQPDADMIYSDEDKLDEKGARSEPYFKPDWSPDFFCSSMYTCHLGFYRKSLIDEIGGFRAGFDGAQDWDLVLRLTERTDRIYHIPKVLYHWRKTAGSTALSADAKDYAKAAQIKAVSEHFQRRGIEAEVTEGLAGNLLRVKRKLSVEPKVSIIIPTRDQVKVLQNCIGSIREKSTYQNYEIILVDNNSFEPETFRYFEEISKEKNIRIIEYHCKFNFAAINNFAAKQAEGELLLFLNNDTEVIAPEWLEAMIEHAVRPEVGAVGARLLYSNNTVQHAGVIIGIGGVAGHAHKRLASDDPGYFSRAKAIQNLSAVTAACLMIKKEVFESIDGFDAKNLAVAFNDVDLCLRIRQKELLLVYSPYAELYHHESISRGADQTPEKALRFQREAEYMLSHWNNTLENDPYYNPNLSLKKEDFSIRIKSENGQ